MIDILIFQLYNIIRHDMLIFEIRGYGYATTSEKKKEII